MDRIINCRGPKTCNDSHSQSVSQVNEVSLDNADDNKEDGDQIIDNASEDEEEEEKLLTNVNDTTLSRPGVGLRNRRR